MRDTTSESLALLGEDGSLSSEKKLQTKFHGFCLQLLFTHNIGKKAAGSRPQPIMGHRGHHVLVGLPPLFLSGTFFPILNPLFWPWLVLRNLRSLIKVFFIPRMPAITSVMITWIDNTGHRNHSHTQVGKGTEVYENSQQTFKEDFSLIAEGNLESYYHPQYSKTLLAFSFWYHGGLKAIYSRKLIFYDRWYKSKTTP